MSKENKEKKNIREEDAAAQAEAEPETEEIREDAPAAAPEAEANEQESNPLEKQLEEAGAKAAEYLAMAQRVQADFENYRKRNESVRADAFAEGRRDVSAAMLPVLDNLERAVDAAAGCEDEALRNGIGLVLRQMTEVYQKLDVSAIDRKGEKFDPNLENAVLQGTEEDGEPGTVCQVLQKGYRMGDKVLRHAMVKVVPE